jgi:hypothetical protein
MHNILLDGLAVNKCLLLCINKIFVDARSRPKRADKIQLFRYCCHRTGNFNAIHSLYSHRLLDNLSDLLRVARWWCYPLPRFMDIIPRNNRSDPVYH